MSFFVCNKCYTFVEKSSQAFILTQCGHIFCNQCTSEGWKQCPECGSEDFVSMPLTRPLKIEATMDYFDKLKTWLRATLNASKFHQKQLRTSMLGLKKTEQKYEQLKAKHTASFNDMEKDMERYALLKKQSAELDCGLQTLQHLCQSLEMEIKYTKENRGICKPLSIRLIRLPDSLLNEGKASKSEGFKKMKVSGSPAETWTTWLQKKCTIL